MIHNKISVCEFEPIYEGLEKIFRYINICAFSYIYKQLNFVKSLKIFFFYKATSESIIT